MRRVYPECDGKLFYIKEWGKNRPICKGWKYEEDNKFKIIDNKPHYLFVRGFGESWYVPLIEIKEENINPDIDNEKELPWFLKDNDDDYSCCTGECL